MDDLERNALRGAIHSMIVALRSASIDAVQRGRYIEADALTERANLGEAALSGPDAYIEFLIGYGTRVAA